MDITTLAQLASEDDACRVCFNIPSALIGGMGPRWRETLTEILAETPSEVKEEILAGLQKGSEELLKEGCRKVADGLISNGHLDVYYTALNWAEL